LNGTILDRGLPNNPFADWQFHTFLGSPDAHPAQGVKLTDWLGQMVRDDASWQSLEP
jgi:hypothetical protein